MKTFLSKLTDPRRKQGQRYDFALVILFSIFAVLSGAKSYRGIFSFIKEHYQELRRIYKIERKNVPDYGTIRNIIQAIDPVEFESIFRTSAAKLDSSMQGGSVFLAADGKALRGSFDNFADKKAAQIFNVLAVDSSLILAHVQIDDKTNEIPVAQELIDKLGLKNKVFTFDAMNCQKKL